VPGRALLGARLLHEQVVVEEPHPGRAHQLAREPGRRRLPNELLVLGDGLPVAEVLDEAPGVGRAAGDDGARARGGQVPLDAPLDERDVGPRERTAQADGAVPAEAFDEVGIDRSSHGQVVVQA